MDLRELWHTYCVRDLQAKGGLETNSQVAMIRSEKEHPGQRRPGASDCGSDDRFAVISLGGAFCFPASAVYHRVKTNLQAMT